MMNKKGDGHVDWIISIGIFLVFLLSIFVIIKPGIEPNYDYNTLLDNLEEHVKGDFNWASDYFGGFYWNLYKIPLYIKGGTVTSGCIKIDFPYSATKGGLNVYSTEIVNGEEILTPIKRDFSNNNLFIDVTNLNSDYKKFMIYYSDNPVYGEYHSGSSQENIGNCVDNSNGAFDYNLGINEKTSGVAEGVLGLLKLNDKAFYKDKLKRYYGYPQSKEFSITITTNSDTFTYEPIKPDVKSNVYVREWGDYILNYDGTRTPVKVSIKVW